MIRQSCTYRVILRYILFQLPGLAAVVLVLLLLHWWLHIPLWSVWTISILWAVKDLVLFPFVWRAYDRWSADMLTGAKGTATETLCPAGYVTVKGELWKAEIPDGSPPVGKGEVVRVKGLRGLKLLVQAEKDTSQQ
jgi:membrane protein implicated in regulation of membrane protease activity